jgi:hypothetical protein
MNIGVVTTSFPRWPGDFAGCFVEDAVRALIAGGAHVEVIAAGMAPLPARGASMAGVPLSVAGGPLPFDPQPDRPRPDAPPPDARVFRVHLPAVAAGRELFYQAGAPEILERGEAIGWAQALFFWAGLCRQIRERARAGRWNRIVAHWLVPCALAARATVPWIPLTAYAHSGDVALLERLPGGDALARFLARGIEDLVFVSQNLRQRFGRLAGRTVGRVAERPMSVSSGAAANRRTIARALARADLDLSGRLVLSVGRLVPIKGFDVLVRAAALAHARAATEGGRVTVVLLGDGPERVRLETMARRLNVDLRLPGFVPRNEVGRWMAAADLYVQPSLRLTTGRTEGLPTATLEALASGLPVVASATGGLAEVPGVIRIPPGDARILSAHLAFPCPPYLATGNPQNVPTA